MEKDQRPSPKEEECPLDKIESPDSRSSGWSAIFRSMALYFLPRAVLVRLVSQLERSSPSKVGVEGELLSIDIAIHSLASWLLHYDMDRIAKVVSLARLWIVMWTGVQTRVLWEVSNFSIDTLGLLT